MDIALCISVAFHLSLKCFIKIFPFSLFDIKFYYFINMIGNNIKPITDEHWNEKSKNNNNNNNNNNKKKKKKKKTRYSVCSITL